MKAPLRLDYDYDPEFGSSCAIYDADGSLIVEEPGPEATWQDLEALVDAYNAMHPASDIDMEQAGQTDIKCGKLIVGKTALEIMRRQEAAKAKAEARRHRARIVGGLPVEDGVVTSGERGANMAVRSRTCQTCSKTYDKPDAWSWASWRKSRYCSRDCMYGRNKGDS